VPVPPKERKSEARSREGTLSTPTTEEMLLKKRLRRSGWNENCSRKKKGGENGRNYENIGGELLWNYGNIPHAA